MPTNDFLPFAGASGANVITQSDYSLLPALSAGFQAGVAKSAQLNKVFRQSSIMAAVLGAFIADTTGLDVVDDGTTETILANLKSGVKSGVYPALQAQTATAFTTDGSAPAFTLSPVPAIAAYAANQRFRIKAHAAGTTGSNTLNVSGLGAKNLKQYDQNGNKAPAVIAANQLADVEYDGTDFVILDPLPVAASGGFQGARKNLKSAAVVPISLTGTTTSGSNQVTAASTTAGLIINGTYITGAGIPAGTCITNIVGTTLTLSANATASASGVALTAYSLNNRTTTADALVVSDGAGNYKTLANVNVTGNIGTAGANGLDTGALAASTWYYEHVIYNPTTQAAAKLYSLSPTAPTLPSGYTMWARTGAVRADTNKVLLYTLQYDRSVKYVVAAGSNVAGPLVMASGTSIAAGTAVAVGAFVPPTAAKIQISVLGGNMYNGSWISAGPSAAYTFGSTMNTPIGFYYSYTNGGNNFAVTAEFILESSNIYWAASTNNTSYLYATGWEDNL